jgi:serine/threonine protein phosphatase PrpC
MLRAAETTQMTDTGRQRSGNEDALFARAPVFVVADGMGGAQAGEVASQMAIEAFEQGLPDSGSPEERLTSRIQEANRRIHELSRTKPEHRGMGTTLTAAYVDDAHVAVAHVGDSRAYLFREGTLQRLTQDHSLVGELVRQGKLTEEEAEEHPQRSVITRALGPDASVDVDTWSYLVRHGDVLMLCSDGLTSMIGEAQIAEILGSAATLKEAGARLIRAANEAGGRDNITVVLFRLEEVGGAVALDDATIAGGPAVSPPPRDSTSGAAVVSPPRGPSAPSRVPLARTQGSPRPAVTPRRGRRYAKPLAALIAVLAVLFLVGGGGYLATRQLYFVSTNSQGIVTIYRGLPYDLPAGIRLYETFYVSGVPASLVPAGRRGSLFSNDLRSQGDAESLVRDLELGRVAR